MFWTRRKIRQLIARVNEAQGRIRELFLNHVVTVDATHKAWGQFIDEETNNQYGIYGTSAGIQVLTMAGYAPEHEIVAKASRILNEAFIDDAAGSKFQRKRDPALLYKIAAISEAACSGTLEVKEFCYPMDELANRILPNQGWGEFFYSDEDKDTHPRVLSTACALLALRRYNQFRGRDSCKHALGWLCIRLPQNGKLPIHSIALSTLALVEYRTPGVAIKEYDLALDYCKKRLLSWARSRKRIQFGSTEDHHYPSSSNGERGNRFLSFVPDCLAALALLKLGSPNRTRRYVLRIVDFFVGEILNKGGFAAESLKRKSSLNHLWIYRLFEELRTSSVEILVPLPWFTLSTTSISVRLAATFVYFAIGAIAVYQGILHRNSLSNIPPWQLTAWTLLGMIGIALFVRMVYDFFHKPDN